MAKALLRSLVKALLRLYGFFLGERAASSRPGFEGDSSSGLRETLWDGYKFYVRPVERAEPGKGIEDFFRGQDFSFPRGDIAYANLEAPIAGGVPTLFPGGNILGAPRIGNSPAMFERFSEGGRAINAVSTANNHCLDRGEAGLVETLDFLDGAGCPHAGTARSREESETPLVIEKGGMRLCFLSYTYSLNRERVPRGKGCLVNHLRLNRPDVDVSPIRERVARARSLGADLVVVCLHWGLEFECYPLASQMATARRIVECGVDVILGTHPHNVQPVECHDWADPSTGEPRRGLIAYSLGDLVSRLPGVPNSALGYLARFRFAKGENGPRAVSLGILPFYQHATMRDGACEDFRVLDILKLAGELRSGIDAHGIDPAERREVFRLERLAISLLGPALARR